MRLKINADGVVSASIPYYATLRSLKLFIDKEREYLRKNISKIPPRKHYSEEEIKTIRKKAKDFLPKRLAYLAELHGFECGKISCRNQKTRWGSCSQNKNISLNIALVLLPTELIDYVLLHELTHTKHMNHGKDFWAELEKVCPNAKQHRKEIKKYTTRLN